MLLQIQAAVAEGRAEEAAAAEAELSELGGRASYQAASELTTSRHRTCKWIFSLLTQMKLRPGKGQPPLKVLEVCLQKCVSVPSQAPLVFGNTATQLALNLAYHTLHLLQPCILHCHSTLIGLRAT